MKVKLLVLILILGIILVSAIFIVYKKAFSAGTGGEILAQIPREFSIYWDYIQTIEDNLLGNKPRIGDIGTIEATVISIRKSEACPSYSNGTCDIEPYPNDWGTIKIDKIIDYTPYSEQVAEHPIEQPSGVEPSEEVQTMPGYRGMDLPEPKLPEYEPLEEGKEIPVHFLLTTRPAKVRYITISVPRGGPESAQSPEFWPIQYVTHQAEPGKKTFEPIPKEGAYYIFTTKFFYSEVEEEHVTESEITREKVLPGLEVGDKFIAKIRYDGTIHMEEYDIL